MNSLKDTTPGASAPRKGLTRRRFMGVSLGGVAGGLAAAGGYVGYTRSGRHLRLGVVGCGQQGRAHLDSLRTLQAAHGLRCTVYACDSDVARLDAIPDMPAEQRYADWAAMLDAESLDGVIIATPDALHAPIATACLEQGAAVFCEPPMAMSIAEAKALHDRAAASELPFFMAVDDVWAPAFSRARTALAEGTLGQPRWIQTATMTPPTQADWRQNPEQSLGAGAVAHYAGLYAALSTVRPGLPLRASTAAQYSASASPGLPDTLLSRLTYPGDLHLVLNTTPESPRQTAPIFRGDAGKLELPETSLREETSPTDSALGQWLQAVESKEAVAETLRWAYEAQIAVHLALESARTRQAVSPETLQVA